jgi:hypothetical protein
MTDARALLARVSFDATSVADVPYDAVRSALAESSIARVRGLFDREQIRAVLRKVAANFDASADRRHDPRDTEAIRRNFQKLQIGANSGIDTRRTLGRFLRILYNPIFADDIHGMRAHFVTLARFRNRLFGLPEDHAVHGTSDDGFWTCARLHQYPQGGGFMVPHRDLYARAATVEADLGYYQPFLILSECGEDYREGGAYIDLGEQRIRYEAECRAGDVIVYDGRTIHGVADVDPLEALALDRFSGRVAAFASLYRHLPPGVESYQDLTRRATARFGVDEPG